MENTSAEKEEAKEVAKEVASIVAKGLGFYKKTPFGSTASRFLLTCLIFFHFSPIKSRAAGPPSELQQRYRVLKISPIPNPKETPYPDCLTHILCQPITQSGSSTNEKVDLVFFAYRNRTLYPAAKLKLKDEISLLAIPFEKAPSKIRNLKQVNDLLFSEAQVMFVSKWDRQAEFVSRLPTSKPDQTTANSNRDLIIQTLIAHQGKVTGGMNQGFFFWTHVPAMYQKDFWKVQPTRKNALGPLKSILLFKQHLAAKGIDLTPGFLANAFQEFDGRSYPVYRRNDTHWAPSGVRMAANLIADTIKKPPSYEKLTSKASDASLIETVTLEELPFSMPTFERPPSRRRPTEMQPVYRIDGQNETDRQVLNDDLPNAEIHLLGDSFANAYGSGAGQAGLHPHLVKSLKTPVNKIASASGGAAISLNQFARNVNHSKAKIVIWTVGESFLAAPDIWSDIPLDRPDTLMLDKLLSRAQLSHDDVAFHLATLNTPGSFIAVGDPQAPGSLPKESRILWKDVHIANEEKSPFFTASTLIRKTGAQPHAKASASYPISWELWINGTLHKTQDSPSDRDIFQRQKWKMNLNKFAGQTLDVELVCRRIDPSQALAGQPCWILPEIKGASMANSRTDHSFPATQSAGKSIASQSNQTKQATPVSPINRPPIAMITIIMFALGVAVTYALRRNRKKP